MYKFHEWLGLVEQEQEEAEEEEGEAITSRKSTFDEVGKRRRAGGMQVRVPAA